MNDSVWRRRLGLLRIAYAVSIEDVVTVAGCTRFLGPVSRYMGLAWAAKAFALVG